MWQLVVNLKNEISQDLIMNRAQRRMQEKQNKKAKGTGAPNDPNLSLEIEMIQPWSDVLLRTKLPDPVLEGMLEISDKVLQDPERANWGHNLAGQIQDEPLVPHEMMQNYKLGTSGNIFTFLLNIVGEYVKMCMKQQATMADSHLIDKEEWMTQMKSAWLISQWPGEYNPVHIHTECAISTVMYLKVPEFLPSTKPDRADDGCITFVGGSKSTNRLTRNIIKHKPTVGDFFVFPAHLQHCVWPFKTDGDYERRSMSFNADFISRDEWETMQKQQKQMQQQAPPPAPMSGAPEKLTINTDNV